MSHSVKEKRSGIEKIFGKVKPFRAWLNEQDRGDLTYLPKNVSARLGKGWRTEDFVRECWERGLEVRIGTVNKWLENAQPRTMALNALQAVFPTIRFQNED